MEEKSSIHISGVTPVYGCSASLRELYLRLVSTFEIINPVFEIIMVDDASPDNAWESITDLCTGDPRVKRIQFHP